MSDYLLVHGAFGVGWVWDEVAKRLETTGHRAHVVSQLPSTGTDPALLGDLAADAQCVRRMLDAMDEPVVIRDYIEHWNTDAQPFTWTATADEILAKVALTQTNIRQLVDNNAK